MLSDFLQRFRHLAQTRAFTITQQQLLELQQAWQLPTDFSENSYKSVGDNWRQSTTQTAKAVQLSLRKYNSNMSNLKQAAHNSTIYLLKRRARILRF